MIRFLNEYEKHHHIGSEIYIDKHRKDYPPFQKMLFTDVNNSLNYFKDICNFFEGDELRLV